MKYTFKQLIFIQNSYVNRRSYKLCKIRFHHKYPDVHVPDSSMIFRLVKKVCSSGSVLYEEAIRLGSGVSTKMGSMESGWKIKRCLPNCLLGCTAV
jgi:hypothetical protein